MTIIQRLCLPIALLLLSFSAHADIYTCKDKAGHLVTADRAMSECIGQTTEVYTNTGVLKDQLPGAMTPEQKQAAQLQEQKRMKEAREQENMRKEQQYLVTHYPTEQDIETSRQNAQSAVDTKIAAEKQVIKDSTDALNNKQRQQANNQNSSSANTQFTADDLKDTIQRSEQLIQRYLAEKADINRRFDETHKRYLEIVGTSKKNTASDPVQQP